MTRVVVIGPYPPTVDPGGDEVLRFVRRTLAEGSTVEVVSPRPSAATHHADPATWIGARRIARVVRGADRVVWFVPASDGPPVPARPARHVVTRSGLEFRQLPDVGQSERPRRSWSVGRLRAGAPTFVRTLVGRLRRR